MREPIDKETIVRDSVHGYVAVAAHERLVVDQPVTQRLRRVVQAGPAELVFPEAQTSRFTHSLGTMHLASRFLLSCIENAEESVVIKLLDEIGAEVFKSSTVYPEDLEDLLRKTGTISPLGTARLSFDKLKLRQNENKYRPILTIAEAGLRLAALFHDLGHLPFSHDLEYALKDYGRQQEQEKSPISDPLKSLLVTRIAPHERIGHELAHLVFRSTAHASPIAVRTAYQMARTILNAEPDYTQRKPNLNAIEWLHSLIDGEIDADRGDFLLRDGRALGLDFINYDLNRLTAYLVLVHDADLGFVTAVNEHGLSALESYCIARSRSYQVLTRHHKVAQCAAALRYASVAALRSEEGTRLLSVLERIAAAGPEITAEEATEILNTFAMFDDGWWIQVLRGLRGSCHGDELLEASLGLILDRSPSLQSLWKRNGELSDSQLEALNKAVDEKFSNARGPALADYRERLLKKKVLVITHHFKPFEKLYGNDGSLMPVLVPQKNAANGAQSTLKPASKASRHIGALWDVWRSDVHVHACTLRLPDLSRTEEQDRKIKLKEETISVLTTPAGVTSSVT